jgi:hypothetical protein
VPTVIGRKAHGCRLGRYSFGRRREALRLWRVVTSTAKAPFGEISSFCFSFWRERLETCERLATKYASLSDVAAMESRVRRTFFVEVKLGHTAKQHACMHGGAVRKGSLAASRRKSGAVQAGCFFGRGAFVTSSCLYVGWESFLIHVCSKSFCRLSSRTLCCFVVRFFVVAKAFGGGGHHCLACTQQHQPLTNTRGHVSGSMPKDTINQSFRDNFVIFLSILLQKLCSRWRGEADHAGRGGDCRPMAAP